MLALSLALVGSQASPHLAAQDDRLSTYVVDPRPVGLYVERGRERAQLVRGACAGNLG